MGNSNNKQTKNKQINELTGILTTEPTEEIMLALFQWLISWLFASPEEYRIPPGASVLVIEISKHYIRYFKLRKPESDHGSVALRDREHNRTLFLPWFNWRRRSGKRNDHNTHTVSSNNLKTITNE
jgi:hypothetical protein